MRLRAFLCSTLFMILFVGGYAQPPGTVRAPFKLAVTTNPAAFVFYHVGVAVDYRHFARHSFGLEYVNMGRALHVIPSPDTIPTLDNWLAAEGHRFMLRYKAYPFYVDHKARLSRVYLSAQFMWRDIKFGLAPLEYTELLATYRKNVREHRQGGRLDLVIGTDIPVGDYILIGGFTGLGLGMERIRQFNIQEHDLTNVPAPGRQFFNDEPNFTRNLLDLRLGIAIGFMIPNQRRY